MGMSTRKLILIVVVIVAVLFSSYLIGLLISLPLTSSTMIIEKYMGLPSRGEVSVTPVATEQYTELDVLNRMIIRTAEVEVESDDVERSLNQVMLIADSYNGYVQSIDTFMRNEVSARIVIRVPQEDFFNVLKEVRKVGKLVSENVRSEDVTEQYIDLEARLRNLKAEEEWLVKVMEKAENVQELLSVEKELWRVREEIEKIEGRLRYLEARVEYSTISVSITQPSKPPEPELPELNIVPTLITALTAIYYLMYGLVFLAIAGTPILALYYFSVKIYRRIKKSS